MASNKSTKAGQVSPTSTERKKPYEAPRLTRFGAITALTAGGSGNANEGANQINPNRRA